MLVNLTFVRRETLRALPDDQLDTALRLNILSMIQCAGSGHLGSSLSVLNILKEYYKPGEWCFSSKGHDAPAFYALKHYHGELTDADLLTLRKPNGLPGHPERGVAGAIVSTGSLGMGLSKAVGLAWAHPERQVTVIVGDGELQEGQCYEALSFVNRSKLPNLHVICDANGYQSDTKTLAADPLPGVDYRYTVKGYRVLAAGSEDRYPYHAGALPPDQYVECVNRLTSQLRDVPLWIEPREHTPKALKTLVSAYSDALGVALAKYPQIVVLDADLAWDCGLWAVRSTFPDRFIECGIAEQHMVSMASGLAAAGKLPIVHSFAAFLTRAHEQIRDVLRDTHTNVIFTGMLAGPLPLGPGRSHDAGDLDLLSFQQGPCQVLEPRTMEDVGAMLERAIRHDGSSYLRFTTCRSSH